MGVMVEVGKAIKFLGRMTKNDPEFEVEGYENLTGDKKELEALYAGEVAVKKTAALTVDDNSGTFGPDMGEEKEEVEGQKSKPGKKSGSGKGKGNLKDLPNKLEEEGVIGDGVKLNPKAEESAKREQGGQTRERYRK